MSQQQNTNQTTRSSTAAVNNSNNQNSNSQATTMSSARLQNKASKQPVNKIELTELERLIFFPTSSSGDNVDANENNKHNEQAPAKSDSHESESHQSINATPPAPTKKEDSSLSVAANHGQTSRARRQKKQPNICSDYIYHDYVSNKVIQQQTSQTTVPSNSQANQKASNGSSDATTTAANNGTSQQAASAKQSRNGSGSAFTKVAGQSAKQSMKGASQIAMAQAASQSANSAAKSQAKGTSSTSQISNTGTTKKTANNSVGGQGGKKSASGKQTKTSKVQRQASATQDQLMASQNVSAADSSAANVSTIMPADAALVSQQVDFPMFEPNDQLYCLCQQRESDNMIACLACDEWYHDTCVGLDLKTITDIESYVFLCPPCKEKESKSKEENKGQKDVIAKKANALASSPDQAIVGKNQSKQDVQKKSVKEPTNQTTNEKVAAVNSSSKKRVNKENDKKNKKAEKIVSTTSSQAAPVQSKQAAKAIQQSNQSGKSKESNSSRKNSNNQEDQQTHQKPINPPEIIAPQPKAPVQEGKSGAFSKVSSMMSLTSQNATAAHTLKRSGSNLQATSGQNTTTTLLGQKRQFQKITDQLLAPIPAIHSKDAVLHQPKKKPEAKLSDLEVKALPRKTIGFEKVNKQQQPQVFTPKALVKASSNFVEKDQNLPKSQNSQQSSSADPLQTSEEIVLQNPKKQATQQQPLQQSSQSVFKKNITVHPANVTTMPAGSVNLSSRLSNKVDSTVINSSKIGSTTGPTGSGAFIGQTNSATRNASLQNQQSKMAHALASQENKQGLGNRQQQANQPNQSTSLYKVLKQSQDDDLLNRPAQVRQSFIQNNQILFCSDLEQRNVIYELPLVDNFVDRKERAEQMPVWQRMPQLVKELLKNDQEQPQQQTNKSPTLNDVLLALKSRVEYAKQTGELTIPRVLQTQQQRI